MQRQASIRIKGEKMSMELKCLYCFKTVDAKCRTGTDAFASDETVHPVLDTETKRYSDAQKIAAYRSPNFACILEPRLE